MPETIGYVQPLGKRPSKEVQKRLKSAHDRLIQGQNYRQSNRENPWREAIQQYEGDTAWRANPEDLTADLVSVNISFSTINTLIPFVADENPQFKVHPYSGEATQQNASVLESYMNRLWQSNDVHGTRAIRDAAFDWLVLGDGYVEVSYEIKEKPIYTAVGDTVPNEVDIATFMVNRVNPWDVWIDPYSDGIYNAKWVCRRKFLPLTMLEADDRFTLPKDSEMGDVDFNYMGPGDRERLDHQPEAWVTLYEFYDLVEGWMLSFPTGGETAVRYITHVECPIVQLGNYRILNSPYHMGELEQIAPLQDELNKTRSQMITHRRRNVAKYVVREHAMTEETEEALKSSKVNEVIPVRGNDPFDSILQQMTATPLSSDMYAIDGQIRNDINEVTGVNEYLRGVPQNISRTATEATIIEGATNIRTRHKLLQVETLSQMTGQLLLDIMTDVLPITEFEEMSLYVTGREAEQLNRTQGMQDPRVNSTIVPMPELFAGKYEVRVERGSTELRNPEVKAQQLQEMVQMMLSATPILMQIGVPFNIQRLLELWMEAEGLEDVESFFMPEENQAAMQQMMMMQQAQQAMGGGQAGPGNPQQGAPSQVVGGTGTKMGEPRDETAEAPEQQITDQNSGILSPR